MKNQHLKNTTIRLSQCELETLDKFHEKYKWSRSETMRRALAYLNQLTFPSSGVEESKK